MKKLILPLLLSFSFSAFADNALLRYRYDNPDMLFQMRFDEDNRNYVLNEIRETIKESQGIDIFDTNILYPDFPQITNELNLEEYLDKNIANIIRDSLHFKMKEITTSFDMYKLSYKVGQPTFTFKSKSNNEDSIDLTLDFVFRNVEIDLENFQIRNHSPGVIVTRHPEQGGKYTVTGQKNMTFVDDIFLQLESPADKPLISVETNENEPAVISGQVKIRLNKTPGNGVELEYLNHNFSVFDSKDAEILKDKIKVYISKETKVSGLDAIEIGRTELKLKGDVSDLIFRKRIFILNLVIAPLVGEVQGEFVTNYLKDNINAIKINGRVSLPIGTSGFLKDMGLKTEINTVGILDNDQPEKQQLILSTNNTISWLNEAFKEPEILPFPLVDKANYQKSLDLVTEDIRNGRHDLIVSLGQDYINHMVYNITKGHVDLPNDPSSKMDDMISNGKKGVFLVLDNAQEQQGKVVVDIMIKPKFFMSLGLAIATLKTKLYFPIIIVPELDFEMKNNIPQLVIKVKDIDMTEETLRKGLYGVASNLNKGISRKLVINKIRQTLSPMIGSVLKSIPLPGLEGLNPKQVSSLESDGLGRLNLKVNLRSTNLTGKSLAEILPKVIGGLIKKKS